MNQLLKKLNKYALESISHYQNLQIYNNEEYTHIALFIDHTNELKLAQSNINTIPTGITITRFDAKKNKPTFGFKQTLGNDWNEYFNNGQMEFRRLKIIL